MTDGVQLRNKQGKTGQGACGGLGVWMSGVRCAVVSFVRSVALCPRLIKAQTCTPETTRDWGVQLYCTAKRKKTKSPLSSRVFFSLSRGRALPSAVPQNKPPVCASLSGQRAIRVDRQHEIGPSHASHSKQQHDSAREYLPSTLCNATQRSTSFIMDCAGAS